MTNDEIVNALECCIGIDCHICPFMINSKECNNIESLVLDLINRQKEEIEKLKTQLGKSENFFTVKLDKEQLNDIVKSQLEKFEVDATEVVRCKDCINSNTEDCAMYYQCNCGEQHTWESDNDYCSWGKRKMEDTDD